MGELGLDREVWECDIVGLDGIRISLLNGAHFNVAAVLLKTETTIATWMVAMRPMAWVWSRTENPLAGCYTRECFGFCCNRAEIQTNP